MKRTILLLVLLVVLASATFAEDIEFKIDKINTSILPEESASYQLRIINRGDVQERFQISTNSAKFVVTTNPKLDSVTIAPGTYEQFMIYANPRYNVGSGAYGIPIKFKSLATDDIYDATLPIHIIDPDMPPGVYPPNPTLTLDIADKIDPRDSMKVTIQLRNRNPRDLESITIMLESDLEGVERTYSTNLNGMEEKGNELLFDLDPLEKPGKYKLTAKLVFEEKIYAEDTKNFEVLGYAAVADTKESSSLLLRTHKTLKYTNNGNSGHKMRELVETNWLRNIFIKTEPKAEKVTEDGRSYLAWEFTLGPEQSYEISIVENYRVPVIILLVIAGIIIAYFLLRSPVICQKAAHIGKAKEGVSDVKVKLLLKNRSRLKISNVRITDTVPAIAEYVQSSAMGTMHPSKVTRSSKKGTLLHYDLHTLEPFEERIITYDMKSKLKIIGGISLKPARVRFEAKQGAERKILSNDVKLKK